MHLPNKIQVETIKMASRILSSIIFNTTSIHPGKLAGNVTNKIGRLKRDRDSITQHALDSNSPRSLVSSNVTYLIHIQVIYPHILPYLKHKY